MGLQSSKTEKFNRGNPRRRIQNPTARKYNVGSWEHRTKVTRHEKSENKIDEGPQMQIKHTLPDVISLHDFIDATAAEEQLNNRLVTPQRLSEGPIAIHRSRAHASVICTPLKTRHKTTFGQVCTGTTLRRKSTSPNNEKMCMDSPQMTSGVLEEKGFVTVLKNSSVTWSQILIDRKRSKCSTWFDEVWQNIAWCSKRNVYLDHIRNGAGWRSEGNFRQNAWTGQDENFGNIKHSTGTCALNEVAIFLRVDTQNGAFKSNQCFTTAVTITSTWHFGRLWCTAPSRKSPIEARMPVGDSFMFNACLELLWPPHTTE